MNISNIGNYGANYNPYTNNSQKRTISQADMDASFKIAHTVFDPRTGKQYFGGKELEDENIDFGGKDSIIATKDTFYNGFWSSKGSEIVRKYEGKESTESLRNRYTKGDELSKIEYNQIFTREPEAFQKANFYHRLNTTTSSRLKNILSDANINLGDDEELNISIDESKNIVLSGLDDMDKLNKISDALKNNPMTDTLTGELRAGYWRVADIQNQLSKRAYSDVCAKSTSYSFLHNFTNGLTLDDLKYENGKILGLPDELSDLVNNATYTPDPKTGAPPSKYFTAKVCLSQVLDHIQAFGKDSIPTITAKFSYKSGIFTAIEQPEYFNKFK